MKIVSRKSLAEFLGVSKKTITNWTRAGFITPEGVMPSTMHRIYDSQKILDFLQKTDSPVRLSAAALLHWCSVEDILSIDRHHYIKNTTNAWKKGVGVDMHTYTNKLAKRGVPLNKKRYQVSGMILLIIEHQIQVSAKDFTALLEYIRKHKAK